MAQIGLKEEILDENISYKKWLPYTLYYYPDISIHVLEEFQRLITSCVNRLSSELNYYCPIPTSGLPLIETCMRATNLPAITYPKWSTLPSPIDNHDLIEQNPNVLMIDTNLNTSGSFRDAIATLDPLNPSIEGMCLIVFNDIFPGKHHPMVKELIEEKRLFYLSTVSELVGMVA